MNKEQFKEMLEEFVGENFTTDGCRECHEQGCDIIPQDHKGSYDKATTELFNLFLIKFKEKLEEK